MSNSSMVEDVENAFPLSQHRRLKGILALLPPLVRNWSNDLDGGSVELQDIIDRDDDIAIVLLLDPRQEYSFRLIKRLCEAVEDIHGVHIMVALQRERSRGDALSQLSTTQRLFQIPLNERFGMWKLALGFSACPALAVIDSRNGQKISHPQEELAVLWNEGSQLRDSWLGQRTSALTGWQRVQAALLFPTCAVQ